MVKYRMYHPESDCEFIAESESDMEDSLHQGCDIIEEMPE